MIHPLFFFAAPRSEARADSALCFSRYDTPMVQAPRDISEATTPPHFFSLTPDTLAEHVESLGLPRFRATQLLEWVYGKGVLDFAAMTNLSKLDRDVLAKSLLLRNGRVVTHQRASDGTQKLLLDWSSRSDVGGLLPVLSTGDEQTECVMIPSIKERTEGRARKTACVSSQVGCPVGCRFCASGLGGLDRNLTSGQIVEQVWSLGQLPEVDRISHVVFMGMGEPLANFNAVSQAIQTMNAPWGLNISARRITVSTVGLPAQIRRLADLELPITLAISLHAPNDEIRRELIPWAERVTVKQLMDAAMYFFEKTGREVTLEYTLMRGVNDQLEHANELAGVAKKLRSHVNLIRYNEVAGLPFERPLDDDVRDFRERLASRGVNVHVRASRGRDIAAACGQLRYEFNEEQKQAKSPCDS